MAKLRVGFCHNTKPSISGWKKKLRNRKEKFLFRSRIKICKIAE